jgi:hypothetical protein
MSSACLSLDSSVSAAGLSIDMASGTTYPGSAAAFLVCVSNGDALYALCSRGGNLMGFGLRADFPLPLPPVVGISSSLEDVSCLTGIFGRVVVETTGGICSTAGVSSIIMDEESTVAFDCDLVDLVERPGRTETAALGVALCCLAVAFFLRALAVEGAGDCVELFRDGGLDFGGFILVWTRRKSD